MADERGFEVDDAGRGCSIGRAEGAPSSHNLRDQAATAGKAGAAAAFTTFAASASPNRQSLLP